MPSSWLFHDRTRNKVSNVHINLIFFGKSRSFFFFGSFCSFIDKEIVWDGEKVDSGHFHQCKWICNVKHTCCLSIVMLTKRNRFVCFFLILFSLFSLVFWFVRIYFMFCCLDGSNVDVYRYNCTRWRRGDFQQSE